MADIIHEFPVSAIPERVFALFATPGGLEMWWAKSASGDCQDGGTVNLYFGPGYDWKAKVRRYEALTLFELEITEGHSDWVGTRVGCELSAAGDDSTNVRFYHKGWPEENEHWRISCYCWAMYLRILKRNAQFGETVEYEKRLDA